MQKIFLFLFLEIALISCARVSLPTGGIKDITPPKPVLEIPENFSTQVDKNIKEIKIKFNEYIILKDISKQVVISPPLQIDPLISPTTIASKELLIKLKEPLKENTTYTFNFGSSIQDNNEGNKLSHYVYTISTGKKIDSLFIDGQIKSSLKRQIDPSTVIGLYKVMDSIKNSSLDLNNKPYYVTKVDSTGHFKLEHLHKGKYKLFAFTDKNANLIFDPNKEEAGFIKQSLQPTTGKDTSLITVILSPIKTKYKLIKATQESQGNIKINFNGNPKEVKITSLTPLLSNFEIDHKPYSDSLNLYFNPSKWNNSNIKEKLQFLVSYHQKQDSLTIVYDNTEETPLLLTSITKDLKSASKFSILASNYLTKVNSAKINISDKNGPLKIKIEQDSINKKQINLKFPVAYDTQYQLKIDSCAFYDFLGNCNKLPLNITVKTKKESDYGNLTIKLVNKPLAPFFMQLLNEKYEVLENIYGNKDIFRFFNLNPGKYLLRILVDSNKNKIWDPANIDTLTLAEPTYIYPGLIEIRAFWDIDETWAL